jgi:carbonic anhydrase/acetyltransferase-like protein (isoleucine patch superfamily)
VIRDYRGVRPALAPSVFVAESAAVIGDVAIGADSSVWFGTVVRGDVNTICIGAGTNIQDLCMVHVTGGRFPTVVGDRVTVGHRAILHGCTVRDGCLIGMGAIVLDDAEVGEGAMVGAGALVSPGARVPPGMLAVGVPARVVRPLTDAERVMLVDSAAHYIDLAREYALQP